MNGRSGPFLTTELVIRKTGKHPRYRVSAPCLVLFYFVFIGFDSRALQTNLWYIFTFPLLKTRTTSFRYQTIMSYRCGSSNRYINHFSNPDVSVLGLPTGVADEADCARRIGDTMVRGCKLYKNCRDEVNQSSRVRPEELEGKCLIDGKERRVFGGMSWGK